MGEGGIDQMCIVISASLIEPYLIVVLICILASGNHSCIVFRIIVKIHNIGIKCSSSCRVSSFEICSNVKLLLRRDIDYILIIVKI